MISQWIVITLIFVAAFIVGLFAVTSVWALRDKAPEKSALRAAIIGALAVLVASPTVFAAIHHPHTVALGVGVGVFTMMKALYGKAKDNRSDLR